jgi:hypothetical protein
MTHKSLRRGRVRDGTATVRTAREIMRLEQWAMRAADHINCVTPHRAPHLGSACDYAREFMGHECRCGHRPVSWGTAYVDMLSKLDEGAAGNE